MKDILDNKALRTMPYDVPEGYFEGLDRHPAERAHIVPAHRRMTYTAIAATFALLLAVGGYLLGKASMTTSAEDEFMAFSDGMTNAIHEETSGAYAEALTDEEIIEYLIYTDIELEELY